MGREAGLESALRRVASERAAPVPLQPVLRDIWWSHVLFAADDPTRITGDRNWTSSNSGDASSVLISVDASDDSPCTWISSPS